MNKQVSYGQLRRALLKLKFIESDLKPRWKAYRHAGTDTLILLAHRRPSQFAREQEISSVIRHVVEKGIAPEEELDRLLQAVA